MKNDKLRRRDGAALGLAAVLALALVMLVVAFFIFSLYFGGSRETRNATDGGALNVGKKSLFVRVSSNGGDEDQFQDVADKDGQFGLSNINRVWSKALWVGINADGIKNDGVATGATNSHNNAIYQACKSISDRLSDKLNDPNNLYSFFDEIANDQSVRMLGANANTKCLKGSGWQTSCLERNQESNVFFPMNLPSGSTLQTGNFVTNTKPDPGTPYIPGYTAVSLNGHDYFFVPFKNGERPRLESKTHFDTNKISVLPVTGWSKPVPNTFSVEAQTTGATSANQSAMAWVKANPMVTTPARIPHGYIRLKFPDNTVNYTFNGLPAVVPPQDNYGYFGPVTKSGTVPEVPACGQGFFQVSLANEYGSSPNLLNGLFTITPQPQSFKVLQILAQRCAEMKPGFGTMDVAGLLQQTKMQQGQDTYYFVSSEKNSSQGTIDPKNTQITIESGNSINSISWIQGKQSMSPDSSDEVIMNEIWPPFTSQNSVTQWQIICESLTDPSDSPFSEVDGGAKIHWKPGTGYNGFLGEITVERWTNVRLFGVCSCVF